jgi:hypothetical protein
MHLKPIHPEERPNLIFFGKFLPQIIYLSTTNSSDGPKTDVFLITMCPKTPELTQNMEEDGELDTGGVADKSDVSRTELKFRLDMNSSVVISLGSEWAAVTALVRFCVARDCHTMT